MKDLPSLTYFEVGNQSFHNTKHLFIHSILLFEFMTLDNSMLKEIIVKDNAFNNVDILNICSMLFFRD